MEAISYTEVHRNLAGAMDKVVKDHDTVIITREGAEAVVMMSLAEFNSMRETMYLLGNPANAARLRRAVAEVDAGKITEVTLDDLEKI